eukprot:TRINITY_DN110089_c0_g1_i1.p1 TRINITY_DN110089_c0_g1~~TRINITY_DN110089_c0_g1_i1.p1  ORF type:complete len:606 (+),score=125.18 TRINITY_DN110089_c0_g1_i1:213-1820(+)
MAPPPDATSKAVQVFPGPHAVIQDISHAAVFYNADDMLEQGYRIQGWKADPVTTAAKVAEKLRQANAIRAALDKTDAILGNVALIAAKEELADSNKLSLHPWRSVEGLKQFLRNLAEDDVGDGGMPLPAHVSRSRLLSDIDFFVKSLDSSAGAKAKTAIQRYGHFEAFFAYHWDVLVPADALQVAYEQWRRNPAFQTEATDALLEGQSWKGHYFCTQGRTNLQLDIVEREIADGHEIVKADLTFTIENRKERVQGSYQVIGRLDPEGRSLKLDPIAGSWKDASAPKNFVMVGLSGVISGTDDPNVRRFAGSVPIFGCDIFELYAPISRTPDKAAAAEAAVAKTAQADADATSKKSATDTTATAGDASATAAEDHAATAAAGDASAASAGDATSATGKPAATAAGKAAAEFMMGELQGATHAQVEAMGQETSGQGPVAQTIRPSGEWNGALIRYIEAIDAHRVRFRKELQRHIKKQSGKDSSSTVKAKVINLDKMNIPPKQLAALLEAAKRGGATGDVSFQMSAGENGEAIVVKLR